MCACKKKEDEQAAAGWTGEDLCHPSAYNKETAVYNKETAAAVSLNTLLSSR